MIEGLLLFVVAERRHAARPTQRVEFVDEDDAGRIVARLVEQVANPRRADAHEHFNEFRTVDRKERDAGLPGHRPRQQGLAGAGRPDQQDALGNPRAKPAISAGVLEEGDDFPEFLLRLVDAGDISESDLGVLLHEHLGLALADGHGGTETLAEPAAEKAPEDEEYCDRDDPGQKGRQPAAVGRAGKLDLGGFQLFRHVRIDAHDEEVLAPVGKRLFQTRGQRVIGNLDLVDLALMQQFDEFAIGRNLYLLRRRPPLLEQHDGDQREEKVADVEMPFLVHGLSARED